MAILESKVRLRAKILRLSHRGMSAGELASYTGRHKASVLRDYDRWERQGLAGLADGSAPGVKSPTGERKRVFLHERLRAMDYKAKVNQKGGMGILERLNRTFKHEFCFRHNPVSSIRLVKISSTGTTTFVST